MLRTSTIRPPTVATSAAIRPAAAAKSLKVHAAGMSFSMALFPGTSDQALRCALAGRLRLPPSYEDGSDSFYLTDGPADGMVFTLSAEGLPDKANVTIHIHPPPPEPGKTFSMEPLVQPSARMNEPSPAASTPSTSHLTSHPTSPPSPPASPAPPAPSSPA